MDKEYIMNKVYDQLINWANTNGYWAQYLLNSCFQYEEISLEALNNLINCYKTASFPAIEFKKIDNPETPKIFLKCIKNVKNVNLLLSNQEMNFNDHLTVIYGQNGAGKTGYVRIVKSMGDSLDVDNTIYSNLLEKDNDLQSADVIIYNGSTEKTLEWTKDKCDNLNLKIFNSNCVKFSLGNKKEILFMPQDFNFFNLINVATIELSKKAKDRQTQLKSNMTLYGIISGTKVHALIDSIIIKGDVKKEIENFIETNKYNLDNVNEIIEELNNKNSALNTNVLISKISNINKLKNKLENLNNMIFISSGLYNKSFWQEYKNSLIEINNLMSNNVKVEDFVKGLNLDEKQKKLFREFLLTADKYLRSKNGSSFEKEEKCIFCGQPLDKKASELLSSYSKFVTNDNSSKINILVEKLQKNKERINGLISYLEQIEPFLESEDVNCHSEIILFKTNLQELYDLNYNPLSDLTTFDSLCNFDSFKNVLETILKNYEDEIKKLNTQKDNIVKEISENRSQLNEYNSIAILLKNKEDIISNLSEQKNLSPLLKISNSSLSALQSKILSTKYKEKFNQVLQEQLAKLEAPKNINFSPNIVASKLSLKQTFLDKKYDLNQILSEGEQKVIALSHFIAENLIEEKDNVLVFDDPVNSLDLLRMETVARVLVQLALKKQIIIFTHNLVFVDFLYTYAHEILKEADQYYICIERTNIEGKTYTGHIKYEFPNLESYKNYKKILNELMSNQKELRENKNKLYDCFSYMRSALELMVVEKVFKKTVNRYAPDIKMTNFESIDTAALNDNGYRISTLFNKVCRFIPAHSSSPQARIEPTIDILKECYEEFKALDKIFR